MTVHRASERATARPHHRHTNVFFMFTLTWITEKELERVIENKGDEFVTKKNMEIESGGGKMRHASGQQGENERR